MKYEWDREWLEKIVAQWDLAIEPAYLLEKILQVSGKITDKDNCGLYADSASWAASGTRNGVPVVMIRVGKA